MSTSLNFVVHQREKESSPRCKSEVGYGQSYFCDIATITSGRREDRRGIFRGISRFHRVSIFPSRWWRWWRWSPINPIRLHSNRDILHALATISRGRAGPKNARAFIPLLFLAPRPSQLPELSVSILLLSLFALRLGVCYFFHGPRSPQLENGTFERVNASVRDQRACPETKGAGFHAFAPMFLG